MPLPDITLAAVRPGHAGRQDTGGSKAHQD